MFESLSRNIISIVKPDGTQIDGVKASVQTPQVFVHSNDILIEAGDILIRKMSNGSEERLRVLDPGFHEGVGPIGPHYQMKVAKVGMAPTKQRSPAAVTYHVTGPNARINHHSVDNSTNVVCDNTMVLSTLADLRKAVEAAPISEADRGDALDVVDSIKEHFNTDKPKQSVIRALIKSLPEIASIATFSTELLKLCN